MPTQNNNTNRKALKTEDKNRIKAKKERKISLSENLRNQTTNRTS